VLCAEGGALLPPTLVSEVRYSTAPSGRMGFLGTANPALKRRANQIFAPSGRASTLDPADPRSWNPCPLKHIRQRKGHLSPHHHQIHVLPRRVVLRRR
jgi:hypothetical protein